LTNKSERLSGGNEAMPLSHIFLAILATAAWGINFVVIKVGLESFPPLLLSTLRFALAGLPIILIWKKPPAPFIWIAATALFLAVLKFSLLFVSISLGAGPGLSSLIIQIQAFFTVLLAFFLLDERPRQRQWIGMFLAFCGLALIVRDELASHSTLIGISLVIAAALCWGMANIAMKKAQSKNPLHLIIWVSALSTPVLLLLTLTFEGTQALTDGLSNVSASGIFSVFYIAGISTLAGFGIWAYLLKTHDTATVAPYSLLVPLFGMTSSALVLGEEITVTILAAAVLIITGLALNSLSLGFLKRKTSSC
jgi:O-acetylserine/cysteine efflux transporter